MSEIEYATELASQGLHKNPKAVGKERSGIIEEACRKALNFYNMKTDREHISQLMSTVGRRLNARKKKIDQCQRSWEQRFVQMNLHICPID